MKRYSRTALVIGEEPIAFPEPHFPLLQFSKVNFGKAVRASFSVRLNPLDDVEKK
jgi:hypothetical protein